MVTPAWREPVGDKPSSASQDISCVQDARSGRVVKDEPEGAALSGAEGGESVTDL